MFPSVTVLNRYREKKMFISILLFTLIVAAPQYRKIILENELKVILVSDDQYNKSAASMNVLAGSLSDPEEYQGLAHFLEHMAFKGTKTKSALEIAKTIDNVGGYINAYTSEEVTAYRARLLSNDLKLGVNIISDILQNSIFETQELERERGVILQEIGMYLDDPSDMVNDYWQKTAFPNQPIGRLILGKK